MRRIAVLAALAMLTHSALVGASPRIIPQPPPEPLGRLIADSKTIHLLRVASIDLKGVTFKTEAALKGEPDKAPFRFVTLMGNGECEGLFAPTNPFSAFATARWRCCTSADAGLWRSSRSLGEARRIGSAWPRSATG